MVYVVMALMSSIIVELFASHAPMPHIIIAIPLSRYSRFDFDRHWMIRYVMHSFSNTARYDSVAFIAAVAIHSLAATRWDEHHAGLKYSRLILTLTPKSWYGYQTAEILVVWRACMIFHLTLLCCRMVRTQPRPRIVFYLHLGYDHDGASLFDRHPRAVKFRFTSAFLIHPIMPQTIGFWNLSLGRDASWRIAHVFLENQNMSLVAAGGI